MNMRQYIRIGNQSSDGRFSCECTLTKEKFQARVSSKDTARMFDRNFQFRYPKACPFLVLGEGDTFSCLIYNDRPGHCRSFLCSHCKEEEEENK
ncbi:hypothetical protein [Methanospirillum lacunae]